MASFEFKGKTIRLIPQHEIELGDLAFIRQHFRIAGLIELEQGMADMEPDSWRAILIASVRREVPEVKVDDQGIDGLAIMPLIEALNGERAERLAETEAQAEGGDRPTSPTPAVSGT